MIEVIDVDLPSLQSIQLGYGTLQGSGDDSCSLIMRSTNSTICNNEMQIFQV